MGIEEGGKTRDNLERLGTPAQQRSWRKGGKDDKDLIM